MKSGGAAKSYHKITMYVYLFFYFILFLLVVKNGGDEIVTKGEGIYKTIVAAIACFQVTPVFFMFPVGSSFLFAHILCTRKKINLFAAWIMSLFVIPVTFAGIYFSRFSFDLLYRYLIFLLPIIILLSLFYSKVKWIIAIVSLYCIYFAELYLMEIFIAV